MSDDEDAFMDGFLMGIAAGKVAMQRMERRAVRAERKLEKFRQKAIKRKFIDHGEPYVPYSISGVLAKGNSGKARGHKAAWRDHLEWVRKNLMQEPPGKGIPLPHDDIWAGQHYNRSGQ